MRSIVPLLLSIACAAASAAPPLQVPPLPFVERVLPNGLQVLALEDHHSPTVSVQVWYHVGSRDDPAGRSGFAHLFEHLMFKRTRHLKAEQFDRLTEDVGGNNNAFTSDDVTAYQEVVPSNHLEPLLWAEAERMSNLQVDEDSFHSERNVVEEEYRQTVLAQPYGRFFDGIARAAYQSYPYKRTPIGSIENLEAATLQDVLAFHDTYYRPDNATLVVTGDFEPRQLQAWVDRYFAPLARPQRPVPRVQATEPPWERDRVARLHGPQVPLPAVALVWLAPPVTGPDTAALKVAAGLLAAGDSSRLNQSLVYRQRVASQAGFDADLRSGPGLLSAYAMAAGGHSLAEVTRALQAEVLKLAAKPPAASELEKVKTLLLTRALLDRQTPLGEAGSLGEAAVLHGSAAYVNEQLQALQRVGAADVQRVMKRYVAGAHKLTVSYEQQAEPAATPQAAASAASGATR